MEKATVYFTNELTPEAVVKMYRQLGVDLPGKVAVKVHSGEDGNQNYLRPEFMKPVIATPPTAAPATKRPSISS